MTSAPPAVSHLRDTAPPQQSAIYKWIATPIIFVSFLVSLAWVDFKYYTARVRDNESGRSRSRWLPAVVHQLLFRPRPYYQYNDRRVRGTAAAAAATAQSDGDDGRGWYYHSKQRKLMKMEVTDAFRIRGTVLAVLVALVLSSTWMFWRAAQWLLGFFGPGLQS